MLDKCIIYQYNFIIGILGYELIFLMDIQIIEILVYFYNVELSFVFFIWIDGFMFINFFILGLCCFFFGRKIRKDFNFWIVIVNIILIDLLIVFLGDYWIIVVYKFCQLFNVYGVYLLYYYIDLI